MLNGTHWCVFTTHIPLLYTTEWKVLHSFTHTNDTCHTVCTLILTFVKVTCAYLPAQTWPAENSMSQLNVALQVFL